MAMSSQQQPVPFSSTVDRIVQDLRSKSVSPGQLDDSSDLYDTRNDDYRLKAAHLVRQTVENAHRGELLAYANP